MAQSITLESGSIFNGNPITFAVQPSPVPVSDGVPTPTSGSSVPSFHRIILEVECGITGGNYEVIKMSAPVPDASASEPIIIDISSALRTFRDSYAYTPDPTAYPLVKFNVKAYDEYMLDGDIRRTGTVFFPIDPASLPDDERDKAYYRTIFGGFSDLARRASGITRSIKTLSLKPTDTPHLAAVGETFAYAVPYADEQTIAISNVLPAPQSKVSNVIREGLQTLGYQRIYALPASEAKNRQQFRFINSFGVMESISVPRTYSRKLTIESTPYNVARQESFNTLAKSIIRKNNGGESWVFQTDPLTEHWLFWYYNEFLMAEEVWMLLPLSDVALPAGSTSPKAPDVLWIPVTITPEEEVTLTDRTTDAPHQITFTAKTA